MTPDPSTVQMVNDGLKHAESFPITIGFFVLIVMFAAFFYWLLFRFYPVYIEEQEKNRVAREVEGEKTRSHLAQILAARDEKAAQAVDAERTAGQQRHTEIVKEIGDSVEKLHAKTDTTHRHLSLVLAKLGVTAVLLFCLSLSYSIGRLTAQLGGSDGPGHTSSAAKPTIVAESCSPACPDGEYCCGKSARGADHRGCCEEKSGTAGSQMSCVEPTPTTDSPKQAPLLPPQQPQPQPHKPVSFDAQRLASTHLADAACSRRMGCL